MHQRVSTISPVCVCHPKCSLQVTFHDGRFCNVCRTILQKRHLFCTKQMWVQTNIHPINSVAPLMSNAAIRHIKQDSSRYYLFFKVFSKYIISYVFFCAFYGLYYCCWIVLNLQPIVNLIPRPSVIPNLVTYIRVIWTSSILPKIVECNGSTNFLFQVCKVCDIFLPNKFCGKITYVVFDMLNTKRYWCYQFWVHVWW